MGPDRKTQGFMDRVREAHDYVKPNTLDAVDSDPCPAIEEQTGLACEGERGHKGPHFSMYVWED